MYSAHLPNLYKVIPSLALFDITEVNEKSGYWEGIVRNARRLPSLIQKILSVARIENKTLNLHKNYFSLEELIVTIDDIQK